MDYSWPSNCCTWRWALKERLSIGKKEAAMRFVRRKQVFSFTAAVGLVLCMVSLNGAGSSVGAQVGTQAPTSSTGSNAVTKIACPDTTKQIITPTATQTSSSLTPIVVTPVTDPAIFA